MIRLRWKISGWLVAVAMALPLMTSQAMGAEAAETSFSLVALWHQGGWIMWVLAVMSLLGAAFIIYFFVLLRTKQIVPPVFRDDVVKKIRTGTPDDIRTACMYKPCPLSEVVLAGLDCIGDSGKADPAMLKDMLEGEGSRQGSLLQGQTQYLLDIAVISPMVGLLGTVFGMLSAFDAVATDLASAKPMELAQGVSQALTTTAAGLIVGIPAMMFYAYFRGRASNMISTLESASSEVYRAFIERMSA